MSFGCLFGGSRLDPPRCQTSIPSVFFIIIDVAHFGKGRDHGPMSLYVLRELFLLLQCEGNILTIF